nr:MAG TPA: hypothetical protein [Caudoviricetes sp.]DAO30330.1 MAG TPA: hypothetical protein [Caudoviricetes sp.]DAS47044.1 MAG TPA: hypothetical protein [Caudoviricetes sp.]
MSGNILKDITDLGIAVVICGVFIRQQSKLFAQQERVISVLAKLEEQLNSDTLRGKALEVTLDAKIRNLRNNLQTSIIRYIVENNLELNWNIIKREINIIVQEEKHSFFVSLKNVTDKVFLKSLMLELDEEMASTENLITKLLEDLKEEGRNEKALYDVAKRSVETHFDHFEARMMEKVDDLLN